MPLLVTSASGANGNGHGALLAFDDRDGRPLGVFREDSRIVDPRGMAVDEEERLVFLNSADRVLALDAAGKVVRDSGVMAGLNPWGRDFWAGEPALCRLAKRAHDPVAATRF
jgi:hypothetical protein